MGGHTKPAKVKTKAARPLVRKVPTKGTARVRELEQRLEETRALLHEKDRALSEAHAQATETHEQQTATNEILNVISMASTDAATVFDVICHSAAQLLNATAAGIFRFDGELLHRVAASTASPEAEERFRAAYPQRPDPDLASGRAVLSRAPVQVPDTDRDHSERQRDVGRTFGFRRVLSVPMLRRDQLIGVVTVTGPEPGEYSSRQIALLKTFADQAVIAIENVRLFTELQQKNEALTQAHAQVSAALDQQTATGKILSVISASPTDVQPVFDAIVESAVRLCDARYGAVFSYDGELVRLAAQHNFLEDALAGVVQQYPMRPTPAHISGRAILTGATAQIPDVALDAQYGSDLATRFGYRSLLAVPILRGGAPIGVIVIYRNESGSFADKQVGLLQTFADQAVIAIENVRLFTELQTSNRELTTALDTQTATSDILRVISRSQTDVQPVFDAILGSAVRLLGAHTGAVTRIAGDQIALAALTSADDGGEAALRARFPQPLHSEDPHAQAIRARVPFNYADAQTDSRWPEAARAYARLRGYRSAVVVPMLRHDEAIGSIGVNRREPGGFADDEIALLKTFADQAVIAIENARLLSELQDKNESLTETLEQQTATSEILRVISSSPTDVQPVFDAIVRSAQALSGANTCVVYLLHGETVSVAAAEGVSPEKETAWRRQFPRAASRDTVVGRAIRERRAVHAHDLEADPTYRTAPGRLIGVRTVLAVPIQRDEQPIGAIVVWRTEVKPFSDKQIVLLQTFADQAVIAIENVRLFTELEASNRELTTALDTQTATADILRVISRSQTDVQPVFDAIVASATRLCEADLSGLYLFDGKLIHFAAQHGRTAEEITAAREAFPQPLGQASVSARAILDATVVQVPDVREDSEMAASLRALFRTVMAVPMLRDGRPVGTITVARRVVRTFSDDQIALLQTFADQAVIAIENARLLSELQTRTQELTRSVDQLTALGDVGRAVSSSLDLDTVLNTIVERAVQLSGTDGGTIFEYDETAEEFTARATLNADEGASAAVRATRLRRGEGAVGHMAITREPFQIPDIAAAGAYASRIRGAMLVSGTRSVLAIPLLHEDRLVGGLVVTRRAAGAFTDEIVELLRTFATQSALAIQNARLFREIEIKSRELEVASQHKSEFLASMSHELRTPLNAIIGFSDVLLQGMFGETNEKQTEYLRDILASGQHLLSLINDILDLSKIEAGRMDLDVAAFDLPSAIDDALLLMRERAGRRGITLERHVDERLGEIRADQRKVKQVFLNLLSNAVKFTPEGGRIDVRATLADGTVEISVTDTGIGIAPEDHDAVFEEFRQVGKAEKKAEGTGLGLALCRKFVELHGGRIWVKSQIGQGSRFTFTLPVSR